jgi:hypothetical protein
MRIDIKYDNTETNTIEANLRKGVYAVILHADRLPPHIGVIAGKKYHSLTIKGQETDLSIEALIKNIKIRKIKALFIRISPHPTFSNDYLKEHLVHVIHQFPKVEVGKANCLSPVKIFFEEAYSVSLEKVHFIFELIPELQRMNMTADISSLNIEDDQLELPVYGNQHINEGIELAIKEAKLIRSAIPA